jgi:hypothetical protein
MANNIDINAKDDWNLKGQAEWNRRVKIWYPAKKIEWTRAEIREINLREKEQKARHAAGQNG